MTDEFGRGVGALFYKEQFVALICLVAMLALFAVGTFRSNAESGQIQNTFATADLSSNANSIGLRRIASVLPTVEQIEAHQRGESYAETSLFEFMVFGFSDEPLFKMEHLNFDVRQRDEPHFNLVDLLSPFAVAGARFQEKEMLFDEGVRYHLLADGDEAAYNVSSAAFRDLFFRPTLNHRFHYRTKQNRLIRLVAAKNAASQAFVMSKRMGSPYCMYLEDTAYRRDYFQADPSSPNSDGQILPKNCPDCGDDRTRLAAIVVSIPPDMETSQVETAIANCVLVKTLEALGVREFARADISALLVEANGKWEFVPEIMCVISALYDPSIREGMPRLDAVQAAHKHRSTLCKDFK